jgi:hypothetical protein
MQSLNIKHRPAVGTLARSLPHLFFLPKLTSLPSERIVSAVIAARPRLGDEEGFIQSSSSDLPSFPASPSLPPAPPPHTSSSLSEITSADFADFGEHFQSPSEEAAES